MQFGLSAELFLLQIKVKKRRIFFSELLLGKQKAHITAALAEINWITVRLLA